MEKNIRTILVSLLLTYSCIVLASPPTNYYKNAEDKQGNALKSALHKIIDGHITIPYTQSGNTDWHDGEKMDVWEALTYTDSVCQDDEPKCGLLQLLYLSEIRPISKANRGSGKDDSWDREHVWPKSRGFANKNQDGYTDLHHLRPADRNINGTHSNYGYDNGGSFVTDKRESGENVITSARLDKNNESFEPTDRAKGQIARMIFYMAVRYDPGDSADPEHMPDLKIRDTNKRVKEAWIGDLCTLLNWHNTFSPTDFERRRNDRVMEIQGNRNPFIDKASWANQIWGDKCHDGT